MEGQVSILYGKHLDFDLTHLSNFSFISTAQVERFSAVKEESGSYSISAFLPAQFSKNYAVENGTRITGKQLMDAARQKLQEVQNLAGGTLAYLDCEPNAASDCSSSETETRKHR